MKVNVVYENLLKYDIKPSVQRMAVMEYLMTHFTHPSVDEIYTALSPKYPTLSRTTVYNTLKLFVEQGAAQMLTIDEKMTCFDGDVSHHAHFLCKRCGKIYDLPLKEENNFYPDFSEIPREVLEKTKLLYINYPNNPTGQVATKEFFENVVKFAQKNNIIVIHDAAYAALTYNDVKPLSFLSVDGAIDVGVEIHSLSKAFNMTGWRLGFLVGNEKIVSAYGVVKDTVVHAAQYS